MTAPVSSSSGRETAEREDCWLATIWPSYSVEHLRRDDHHLRLARSIMALADSEVVAAVTAERERADAELAELRERIEALADEVAASQRLADFDGVVKMRPGAIAAVIRALGSATKTGEGT